MKKIFFTFIIMMFTMVQSFAQVNETVVIGGKQKGDANAALEVLSKNGTKGMMPPRATTAQITAMEAGLTADSKGLVIYDTDQNCLKTWQGTTWSGCSVDIPISADNGLTINSGNIQLGGTLTKPSVLTTTSAFTLALNGLQTGSPTDNILVTDSNDVIRKIAVSSIGNTTAGTNISVTGSGTTGSPYIISSPFQTAVQTPSTAISAVTNTTVAVPSLTVQGAIADLAKEVSQRWGTKGNAGTNRLINFIGTTDEQDLVFRRYGIKSGRIAEQNTSFGFQSFINFSGDGIDNVAIGNYSLYSNTSGGSNTAVGSQALSNNKLGNGNTGIGTSAIYHNIDSNRNTAIGFSAMHYLTTGDDNIAIGFDAGSQFKGATLREGVTTMSQSIILGSKTLVPNDNFTNQIVIGYGAEGRGSNTVQIGNQDIISIGGAVEWSIGSDIRLKKDIVTSTYGLNFINKLRPVTYKMKKGSQELQSGFIAQEVEAAANSIGYEFNAIVKPQTDNDFYSLRYAEFVVPLVKAVQEQQTEIESLKNEVTELKNLIKKMLDRK